MSRGSTTESFINSSDLSADRSNPCRKKTTLYLKAAERKEEETVDEFSVEETFYSIKS